MRTLLSVIVAAFFTTLFVGKANASDWRSDIGIFRVGVFTGDQSKAFLNRAEPFRLALAEALEMEVEFFPARNTEVLIDALRTDRIEYAFLTASAYAIAWNICECVEPIVSPKSADGTDGYHTVVITRSDGPSSIKELESGVLGELSPGSLSQSLLFKQALETPSEGSSNPSLVSEGSGEATFTAYLEGKYDGLLGWSSMTGNPSEGYSRGTLRQIATSGQGNVLQHRIIWKSEQIPHRPHVVRKKLPGEPKNILRNFLIGLFDRNPVAYDSIEPVYGGGFATARHGRYLPLINLVESLVPEKTAEIVSDNEEAADVESQNDP